MSLRLKHTFGNRATKERAAVYYNSDLQEYRVKFYKKETEYQKEADYFTNDEKDAVGTAMAFCKA